MLIIFVAPPNRINAEVVTLLVSDILGVQRQLWYTRSVEVNLWLFIVLLVLCCRVVLGIVFVWKCIAIVRKVGYVAYDAIRKRYRVAEHVVPLFEWELWDTRWNDALLSGDRDEFQKVPWTVKVVFDKVGNGED